ncbi:MAG: gluconate 2-dehydrogenase subunit 3 family protein [Bacteroidota bacterium]
MKRRDSLKFIGVGSISIPLVWESCKADEKSPAAEPGTTEILEAGRQDFEIERDKKLVGEQFFTAEEMATITVLADIIIPKDEKSGSASDAGVPAFIEFIVKDMPHHQVPMRGGLRWLDLQCSNRYGSAFKDCTQQQQLEIVDAIAYPAKAKPEMQPGVAFFNRMRDLTATGFFTTEMGINDLGYMGNRPGKWEGVPADDVAKYELAGVE